MVTTTADAVTLGVLVHRQDPLFIPRRLTRPRGTRRVKVPSAILGDIAPLGQIRFLAGTGARMGLMSTMWSAP